MSRGQTQSVSQDKAYGPPSPPCTMGLFVFGLPSPPPPGSTSLSLFPLSWFGERVLAISVPLQLSSIENNLFWGGKVEGSGLGGRIWDSSCQISFWKPGRGKKSTEKPSGQSLSSYDRPTCGHPLSSGHSWTQSPQNWGETSSLGSRLPRVGMWAVLTQAQPPSSREAGGGWGGLESRRL